MSLLRKLLSETKSARKTQEGIFIPIEVGDIILRGRFRNRKVEVKDIKIDEHGLPLINGKNIVNFRFDQSNESDSEE